MIEIMQLILAIPKTIEAVLFLIIILKLNKKYKGLSLKERPQLNTLYLVGLIGWLIYITLDIFIYIIAPLSFTELTPIGVYTGYDSQFPSLFIANILRDIGFFGALIISWCYFVAAFNIKFGEKQTHHFFGNNRIIQALILTSSIVLSAGDKIKVEINEGNASVNAVWDGIEGAFVAIVILLFVTSVILLSITLRSSIPSISDDIFRRRIKILILGTVFMACGHIYWLGLSLLLKIPAVFEFLSIQFWYVTAHWIGHMLWTLSPIFIFSGFSIKNHTINQ
ncbi:hypothetical protein NEF87_003961 [Candidatus Lokiarchaeum ossiferum]|uniref:Uncharacterized protein n=1 Tax=Candidatus Lokiarchaeum ossiferum TaxID=2951803 RepID=A0ABY6HWB7_9ARCH|nr:hypothetical protein NEF87_003961 [Candidatus Lokiarchaeum sp. B-35]